MLEKLCALIDCHRVTFRHLKAFLLGVSISCKSGIRTLFIQPSHHLYSPAVAAASFSSPFHSIRLWVYYAPIYKMPIDFRSLSSHRDHFCNSMEIQCKMFVLVNFDPFNNGPMVGRSIRSSAVGGYILFLLLLLTGNGTLYFLPLSHIPDLEWIKN